MPPNKKFTESVVEEAVLEWAEALEFGVVNGPEIAPGEPAAERESYNEVILAGWMRDDLLPRLLSGNLQCAQ